ncbi:MAG: hypothetical protein H6577_20305 [Lewinellaceae bacterium]|nr:hypothetical protein [Saprospiraceae bacterium]MCB9340473.1 hypothetical protein [Lewinellaceae bacterium]
MEFIVGILGNLVAEIISGTGQLLFSDLTDNPKWKAWKAEHHLTKNDSDFLDRYGEALVLLKQAGKPKILLNLFAQQNVVEVIHAHWYGTIEEKDFEEKFDDLAKWFTLDKQLEKFSSAKEVFIFLTKFSEAVHANRTAGEAENHQRLVRIENLIEEFCATRQLERTDLYDKLFIFCNAADRPWVEKELVQQLETGGLQVHLDFREYRPGDYSGWSQKVMAARMTMPVFSKNFGKTEKWLLSGYLNEFDKNKLLPLRLDTTEVFGEFDHFIDLSASADASLKALVQQLTSEFGIAPARPVYPPLDEKYVDVNALPHRGASDHLFGRQAELKLLDEAWDGPGTHVITFVAQGGVGKSALISRWVADMAKDNYRGATRVLATSFYSQGTTGRIASSDLWMNQALRWFGETEYDTRSPWDKGKRLAQLVNEHRTLLLLDGLEPMQEGGQVGKGTVKDPALNTLVRQLARRNRGLCIITTREALGSFERFEKNMRSINLETISNDSGVHILRFAGRKGISGSDSELAAAVQAFGNHAFAINLLGNYLYSLPGHSIAPYKDIPDLLDVSIEKGKHSRRVIAVLAKKLVKDGKHEASKLLESLGFFDRPVSKEVLKVIADFDDLSEAIAELRERKLVYPRLEHAQDMVDCHPLVREHSEEVLQEEQIGRWQEGNEKLYRYYSALPEKLFGKYLPDTLEEMEPLFRAVMHGCRSGLHYFTFYSLYLERISRAEGFLFRVLGAINSEIHLISYFFDKKTLQPSNFLNLKQQSEIIGIFGFLLLANGQFIEALKFLKHSLTSELESNRLVNASTILANICEIQLIKGELHNAIKNALWRIKSAGASGNEYEIQLSYCGYADILHAIGDFENAIINYSNAEKKQQAIQPKYKYLRGVSGCRFCDLLFELDKENEAIERISKWPEWCVNSDGLLNNSMELLSQAKACFVQNSNKSNNHNHRKIQSLLNEALDGLRNSGSFSDLPLGLLARAAYHRLTQNYPAALEDLEEVLDIAEPSGMRLHLTDYHLEMARLCLAMSEEQPEKLAEAKEHTELAAQLVEDTGYHRRDGELAELKKALRME